MNWTIYVLFMLYTAALVFGAYQRGRLEKKLEGKADKRKSGERPGGKKVSVKAVIVSFGGKEERQFFCSVCDEKTDKRGHTVKGCPGAVEPRLPIEEEPESLPNIDGSHTDYEGYCCVCGSVGYKNHAGCMNCKAEQEVRRDDEEADRRCDEAEDA